MSDEIAIRQDADRYTIVVDGVDAGFESFADLPDGSRVLYHTEVDPAFGGRGLAGTLVAGVLDDIRAQGKRFVAVCPYVRSYLRKHDEYEDIRESLTQAALSAVPAPWLPDDLKPDAAKSEAKGGAA